MNNIDITRSKRGIPCLWESGGGMSNTGRSIIIAAADGKAKTPIYIRKSGMLSCREHALIPVSVNDIVIKAWQHHHDFDISINIITSIDGDIATLDEINKFSEGEWDVPLQDYLKAAVDAAEVKATTYHCRYPKYIAERKA